MITKVEVLKAVLIRAWDVITEDKCGSIIRNFCKRPRKCIEANGGNLGVV